MAVATDSAHVSDSLRTIRDSRRGPLERALEDRPIDPRDALVLLETTGEEELSALLTVAGLVRDRRKGRVVTYSPKLFFPVTNLCRDRCGYCTFRADPDDAGAWTMLPEEVRAAARKGNRVGCIEALMCLGDKPEKAFRSHRATLAVLGCDTTIEYVGRACEIALDEGMLPHTNAGLMSADEMRLLKPVNVSMGLMLENISPRLRGKHLAHYYAPDKDPAVRMRMIREAGALQIPFTTGLLLGIGETLEERVDSLAAIDEVHRRYGHIQEIIVQNFRAKPATRMSDAPEPGSFDVARTIAVARLMMPEMNLQAPPNLSPEDHLLLLAAGINDWGGLSPVTPDYVNPEAPWPHVARLAETCRSAGFELRPRLPVYPDYLERPGFVDRSLTDAVVQCVAARGVSAHVDR